MDVGGKAVATLSGTMNMMGNVGGFVSPIVCGYIVNRPASGLAQTSSFRSVWRILEAQHVLFGARIKVPRRFAWIRPSAWR